jgi:hypothetical protein
MTAATWLQLPRFEHDSKEDVYCSVNQAYYRLSRRQRKRRYRERDATGKLLLAYSQLLFLFCWKRINPLEMAKIVKCL